MFIYYIIPSNYDFLAASIIEGLLDLGHIVYTSENANYGMYLNRKTFIKNAHNGDLLLIHSGSYCDYSILKSISHKKVVYIDGSDFPWIENLLDYPIHLVFKRELMSNENLNIYPLPFAVENRYFNQLETPKTRITFISTLNNYYRRSIHKYLLNLNINKDILFIGTTGERSYTGISGIPSPTPKYYQLLSESIASINFPGKGWDCARFWEIIASKTCLISPSIEIDFPLPFIENIHYLKFTSLKELGVHVLWCIENPEKAAEIANNAFLHMLKYHTTKKRATYLLQTIDEKYNNNIFFNVEKKVKIKSYTFYLFKKYTYIIWKKYIERKISFLVKNIINE